MRAKEFTEGWFDKPTFRKPPLAMSDYRGPYHPDTMEPYGPEFKDSGELIDIVYDLIEDGVEPQIVEVDPKQLLATQDWLSDNGGGESEFPEYSKLPIILRRTDGKLYVVDGHHRASAAFVRGSKIKVFLFTEQ